MAMTLTSSQQGQYDELKKAQPDWNDDDIYGWGTKYYGWGTPAPAAVTPSASNPFGQPASEANNPNSTPVSGTPSTSTGAGSGGGGAALPPSAPPPSAEVPAATADPAWLGDMMQANPTWSREDALAWGQRYGYGTQQQIDQTTAATTGMAIPPPPAADVPATTTPPYRLSEGGPRLPPVVAPPPPPPPPDETIIPGVTGDPQHGDDPDGDPDAGGEADGGSGVGDNVTSTNPPRTITINGVTYTIPGGVDIDSEQTTGDAPSADAADLNYSPEDPMMGVVRDQLIRLMARANAPVSMDDPTIKTQADANYAAQERARRDAVEQRASSLGARGLGSSGALDQSIDQSYETLGQNVGEFNAGLLDDEQTARRGDLKDALGMANELGMFKEQNKLQRDLAVLDTETKTNLANLDAQLKNAGLTIQERLGIMDAELKKYGIDLQGDMGLMKTILDNEFNYAQLSVQKELGQLDADTKMAIATLDADLRKQGLSTQERLARLDAEVRRYGIDTQGNLGNLEVALRRELGLGQLNLGLLNAMLNNQQFNDQLGWNMASWAGEQNSNILDYL